VRLFVGRHSFAGIPVRDPKQERERALLPEGIKIAKAIAAQMLSDGDLPDTIFCSPFQRTTQTADIYGKAWGIQVNVVGTFAPFRPLEEEILGMMAHGEIKNFMIIGHVDNTTPAFRNLGSRDWPKLVMSEVRKLKIDRDTGDWKIKWTLKPSDLGLIDHTNK
jgi:phosphohistidine phosphatase SixA